MHAGVRNMVFGLAGIVFAAMAGFMIFAATISRHSKIAHLESGLSLAQADGVVVLTGGEARVREGFKLFERVQARRILISGVHRKTTREDLRVRAGLPTTLFSCCVDVGYAARDTIGNASEARDWAYAWGFKRVRVVTSSYHMPRSLLELSDQMPGVELIPFPVASTLYDHAAWWTNPDALRVALIEYVKLLPSAARIGVLRVSNWASRGDDLRAVSHASRNRPTLGP